MDRQYDFAALEALLKKRSFKALREALLELLQQILQELLLMIIKLFSLFYLLFFFSKIIRYFVTMTSILGYSAYVKTFLSFFKKSINFFYFK